ncbi:MAG: carbon-nitrogen hydrolase family protein [Hyphomicrobiaceae bacterium]
MTAPPKLTIAAAQYPIERLANLSALKAKLTRWAEDASRRAADLLVFPEYGAMEIAGTCADAIASDLTASLAAVAERLPEIDAHHADLARRLGLHILAASGPTRKGDRTYVNAARLFTPAGPIGVQEKLIMTPFEQRWGISPGEHLSVFETALGPLGVLICYDSEFPLLARALAEAGARLILVPSCTERLSGYHRVRTGAMARALENSIVTVQSPTVGEALWSPAVDRNAGAAGIYVPAEAGVSDTGVVAEGKLDTATLVLGTVDLAALDRVVSSGEMRNRRDWALQPGATALLPLARCVDLR